MGVRRPLVSLVVICRDDAGYLDATLASVADQTLKNFECIIVNDGSTDGSRDIILQWCRRDRRFSHIDHRTQAGLATACNTGLRASRGEYIAFLEGSTLLMPRSLESRATACLTSKETSARFAGSYAGSCTIAGTEMKAPPEVALRMEALGFIRLGAQCPFEISQPMLQAELLRRFGGFCEGIGQAAGHDLWYRIMRAGYWFEATQSATVAYRARESAPAAKARVERLSHAHALSRHASEPLPENHLSLFPYRLVRPHQVYEEQLRRLDHILDSCGTALAAEGEAALPALADLCRAHVPDMRDLSASEPDLSRLIVTAIQNARTHPSPDDGILSDRLLSLLPLRHAPTPPVAGRNPGIFGEPAPDRHWDDGRKEHIKIIFLPHKDYHVWTISLIAEALRDEGLDFLTIDLTPQWDEAGVRSSASENDVELIGLGNYLLGGYAPNLVVTFNDWDHVTRPLIIAANAAGLPTAAIVEGIQDYEDIDTGLARSAYRAVRHLLLPGDFDLRYFTDSPDQQVYPVGIPRIQKLRAGLKAKDSVQHIGARPKVLINSNFSYGVLASQRDMWLTAAVESVLAAGMTPIISRHPADTGTLYPELVCETDFYTLLDECQITVQRFASGILEAIAREKVVLYFNPHGERVDKFTADPMGVYPIISSAGDLKRELADWRRWQACVKTHGPAFLDRHSGAATADSARNMARILADIARTPASADQKQRFADHLRTIDEATRSLCHGIINGQPLFPKLEGATERLERMTSARLGNRTSDQIDPALQADLAKLAAHRDALDGHDHRLAAMIGAALPAEIGKGTQDILSCLALAGRDGLLLQSCASALLIDPERTLQRIRNDALLAAAVEHALQTLASDTPSVIQFRRIRKRVEERLI